MEEPPSTAVVIPLRSLRRGKLRLSEELSDDARADLITQMAETVIAAAVDLPVVVVHAEDDVAMWAEQLGATAVEGLQPGLNNAVREGVDWARQNGATMAIVAHADLPYATDLRPVAEFDGITLVPDRLRDGTNVICLPTAIDFSFSYGPGSFDIHLETAEATGIPVRVLEDPDLAWDVDHPEDLLPQRQIDQRLVNP